MVQSTVFEFLSDPSSAFFLPSFSFSYRTGPWSVLSPPRPIYFLSFFSLFFFLLLPPDPPSIFSFVLFPPSRSAPLSSHSLHPAHLAAPPLTYWSPLHLSFCADPVAMDTASRLSLSLSRSIHLSHAQPCPARAYLLLSFYGFISPPCSPRRRIRPNRSWAPSFLLSFPSCLFFSPPPKGFISI